MSDCQPCTTISCCPPNDYGYSSDEVELWHIADFGSNDAGEASVATWLNLKAPTNIIAGGDNDYVGNYATSVGGYYPRPVRRQRIFPVYGNHDWDYAVGAPFLAYFTWLNGRRYYDIRFGPIHLFMIDSGWNTARVLQEADGNSPTSDQATVILAKAAASTAPFKVAFLHHPPYFSGSGHGADHDQNADLRWDFAGAGIKTVISGHEHSYERLLIGETNYIINGLGGKTITGFAAPVDGSVIRYNANYGALRIRARQSRMEIVFFNILDTVVDSITLTP